MLTSLLLHVLAFLGWQNRAVLGHFPLFRPLARVFASAPARLQPAPVTSTLTFLQEPAPQRAEDRRQFIETDASQVTGEEPKNARFYSANSTVAANTENPSGKVGDTPYLNGKETRLTSTENVQPQPPGTTSVPVPRPVTPPAVPPVAPQPVASKPVEPVKDLAETGLKVVEEKQVAMLDKPVAQPEAILSTPPQPTSPPPMPIMRAGSSPGREIATAKSHATAMGVSRIGIEAFNVASSPFGLYDKALISAVQSRWYAVLNEKRMDFHAGTVVLQFNLLADGSVTSLVVKENSAGFDLGLYCEKAIVESAPFAPLPESLQRLIGGDTREIVFTFYY